VLLSGSRLAGDENRGARLREPADGAEHLLHRRRVPENFRRLAHRLDRFRLSPALVERAADQVDGLIDVERLRQIFVGAALEGGHRGVEIRIGGHHDDRDRGVALLHRLQQLEARQPRHADIGHQHFRRAAGERFERILRGRKRVERDAFSTERLLDHPADGAVIVDDPDRFHIRGNRILNVVRPGRDSNSMTPW
jgi:hypothetical protein